jgi:hypothetical protein
MFKSLSICSLLLASCCFAVAGEPQEGKLLALESMWNQAQIMRDSQALESLIGDHFVNTEWDGEVTNRERFLSDIRDPKFKPTTVSLQDTKVNIYSATAVVTGTYHAKGSYNAKPYDHVGRFTDTWIYQDGKWQCVASHTSLIAK